MNEGSWVVWAMQKFGLALDGVLNEPLHVHTAGIRPGFWSAFLSTLDWMDREGYRGQKRGGGKEGEPAWSRCLGGGREGRGGGEGWLRLWVGRRRWGGFGAGAGETRAGSRDLASRTHGAWWEESAESS